MCSLSLSLSFSLGSLVPFLILQVVLIQIPPGAQGGEEVIYTTPQGRVIHSRVRHESNLYGLGEMLVEYVLLALDLEIPSKQAYSTSTYSIGDPSTHQGSYGEATGQAW